jgi:anaerobic selenocysteine-containing dehydrogenase
MATEVTRRNLFKWTGFLAAGMTLPKAIKGMVLKPREKPLPRLDSEIYKPALCKLCPSFCLLQIRLVNGKPAGVSGTPGHPVSQGGHCPKGGTILQDLYHPDRLRSPLRIKGERGSNQWEKITWESAHEILYEKLSDLSSRNRNEALAILAAPLRDIRHEIQKRFAQVFGTPNFWEWNWNLAEPPIDGFDAIHGFSEGLFYDISNANLIVSFGWDWLQSFPSPIEAQRAYSELRRARLDRRTRIISIDPRLSITSAKADEWIPIKPNTEGILALGLAHILIENNLYDRDFVNRWTTGFEEYKKVVLEKYHPDSVSEITSVKRSKMDEIAYELANIKPSLSITYRGSLFNQIAVHSLNALLGSIGVKRGVLSSEAERYQLALPPLSNSNTKQSPFTSLHRIPEEILSSTETPIEILWMERVNPVFSSPQPSQWKRAMEKIPFIVSFSSFLDESSQMADLVLPPHHSLEAWQYGFFRSLKGNGVISFAPPVISPLYETADHGDFILNLAKSLGGGIAEALPWGTFVESLHELVRSINAEEVMQKGGWWEYPVDEPDILLTLKRETKRLIFPTGRLEQKTSNTVDPAYPLHLYLHCPLSFSFGDGAHLPYLHSLAGAHLGEEWESWVEIHSHTAKRMGIPDGEMVWVESENGKIKAKARHYDGIREDTVSIPLGLGHTAMGRYAEGVGANPSEILKREIDMTGQPIWQSNRVRVYVA